MSPFLIVKLKLKLVKLILKIEFLTLIKVIISFVINISI